MTELFDIEPSLSPRLKWMQEHKVRVTEVARHFQDEFGLPAWCAHSTEQNPEGTGDTEDEALVDLARKLGIRLWNEQAQP